MQIGIIGAGRIGSTAAQLFIKANHSVRIGNTHDPSTLAPLIATLGPSAQAATPEEVVRSSGVILLAIPWDGRTNLPDPSLFAQKIVIDAMNRYPPTKEGMKVSSEELAEQLPQAVIVRAFNTMNFGSLSTAGRSEPDGRMVLFVAGDNTSAKTLVSHLIEDIGFAPIDTGSLHEGGYLQQPGSPLYNHLFTVAQAQKMLASAARSR